MALRFSAFDDEDDGEGRIGDDAAAAATSAACCPLEEKLSVASLFIVRLDSTLGVGDDNANLSRRLRLSLSAKPPDAILAPPLVAMVFSLLVHSLLVQQMLVHPPQRPVWNPQVPLLSRLP